MRSILVPTLALLVVLATGGCKDPLGDTAAVDSPAPADDDHMHPDGTTHDDRPTDDLEHDEVSLGTVRIGDLDVEAFQAHGVVEAGKESHLVVKLPYNDRGATIIRAWIGTEDRLASYVGRGEYAESHDDFDVHATAPDPLPADVRWWIEIEQPDGTRAVGSIAPRLE